MEAAVVGEAGLDELLRRVKDSRRSSGARRRHSRRPL
jgi:hypothetical protein